MRQQAKKMTVRAENLMRASRVREDPELEELGEKEVRIRRKGDVLYELKEHPAIKIHKKLVAKLGQRGKCENLISG